jgi:amino acid adenylation domain-containing protein
MVQTDTAELAGAEAVFPASFAQQRMWFLERFESSAVYNVPVATRLRGPLDVAALELALGALIERHESLRTVFTLVDGVPHQLIKPVAPFTLDVADVSALPGAVERAVEIASEQARARFNLARDEPIRVALVKIGEDDHLLSLTLHHIAADAWSMGVLRRELAELYDGFRAGEPVELPELEIQYADYAVWQRRWMESGGLDQQLDYWLGQLAGAPPLLELPTDRPRPSRQSFRGATVRTMLPRELMDRVLAFGEQEGATLFMTLLAAFSALLFRYSGQEDVVVASPVANRGRTELERVVGLFVNTLALRVGLEGDPSFRELLARVREVALGAFSNQELPFEKLVEKLDPERHLSHAPVAQVMFVVQNAVERGAAFPELEQERVLTERGTAKFDLTCVAAETPEGLRLSLEYCTDLFEEATALRMLKQYRVLLQAALAEPELPISALRLLDAAEEQVLLEQWNATARPFPAACVDELIVAQARRTPDAVAVECGGESLTFAELDRRSSALANYLRTLGIGPDVLVGVALDRSVELLVGLLGILRAGGAYVPIDPSYPTDRQRYMLEDAAVSVLVTESSLVDRVPYGGARVVQLDLGWNEIERAPAPLTAPERNPEQLAYVIYTSGSTGRPKGVEIPHRALVNFLWAMRERPGLSADDVLIAVTTLSFDIAGLELYLPLLVGARVVVAPRGVPSEPQQLAELVADSAATVMQATPTTWRMLLDWDWQPPTGFKALCGGEVLPVTLAEELLERGLELWNMYGPTETTIWSTVKPLRSGERLTIGRPIANTTVFVLDARLHPVPVGVPGELCIGGVSLARGYRGRPDLTGERFVANPFSENSDARLYRTGDRARWRPDGEIEYLSRADHQVKIRGFRVEPGEIESVLREHPAVREALVVAGEDTGQKSLVAYVVTRRTAAAAATPAELREFLGRSLPEYMIPAAFATLDAFPLTPNGKLDRDALPAPHDQTRATAEYLAPRTDVETIVAEIWQRLLNVDRVGIHDNFFLLGGHSLLAIQLASRIRDALGLELPLRVVFEAPTVAGLARTIEAFSAAQTSAAAVSPITPIPREWRRHEHPRVAEEVCVLPASFSEQRLWFLDRLEPESRAYKLAVASRLRGRLDVAAMERALNELIVRHETLRTTFSMIDGAPQRVIQRPRPMPLPVTDLGESEQTQEHAQALIRAEAERGFDLESGPLLRARLLRLGEDEHIFILTLHHIIVDGWSMGVLNRELSALYSGCLGGRSADLPALPIQYADYASWQRQWIEDGGLDRQLKYWTHQLAGAPPLLELPTDRPRPARQSFRGAIVRKVLPAELLERLRALGEREGTTLYMTLLAAFSVLLSRSCGQEDVVVATPVANRDRSELEGVIGFFVNTLALRVNLEGDPSFRELLGRVRETAIGAYSNQDLPFEKLVEELNPPRQLSYSPVAQVLFFLENPVGESSLELEGLTQERISGGRLTSKFDLSAYAVESSDGLRLSFRYCPDLFEEATVARMLDRLGVLLEAAVDDPDERIGRLPMLTAEERDRLLVEWNSTEVAYPPATLHALIEAQVRRSPEAVAVSCAGEQLTYAELDARANRLARHLRAAGVGPDSLVAVSLERSLELIVSVLGILKAGGAYVPLDPKLPADRLAFMLDDSGADVLISGEQVLPRLPPHAGRTIRIDSDWPEIALESPEVLDVEIDADNLAYVIYTSGSTGWPKGVPNTHAGIVNRLLSMQDTYALGPSDRLLQKTQTSFDVSVREIFWPLLCGARIVVAAPHEQGNPSYLAALIEREQVTTLHFVPSMLRLFLEEVDPARCRSLRCVLAGGETLPADLARAFFARFDCELHNLYGPTEAAVSVTTWRCDPGFRGDIVPIGRPVANTHVYVLDPRLAPVPVGVWGEIFIGGAQLARGYHERPELTAERFIPSPFGPGRLYRTGDIGRWNNDGALEFGGRLDDQIKLRGFRIEPGEIEAVLQEHEAVDESAVIAFESPSGECELAAYVVLGAAHRGGKYGVPDLLSLLRAKLPDHMVPGSVTLLDALPLLSNGKLDRNALPSPDRSFAAAEYVPPRTELERAMAEIWQRVLSVDRVGMYDDFFKLGGHSLMAVRLFAEIERKLGARLPLSALFETTTIAGLTEAIELDRRQETVWPSVVRLRSGDGQQPFFLIAWAGGEVLPYRDLTEKLDVPVFGLRPPGADRRGRPLARVEELAEYFVGEIRRVQPHGPYRLGGFCFSGLVAYEMARQLRAQGETISTLALMDAYPYRPVRRRGIVKAGRIQVKALRHADRLDRREWLRDRVAGLRGRAHHAVYFNLGPTLFEGLAARHLERLIPRRPWNLVLIASNLARKRYVPTCLDVRVTFFRAQRAADSRPTPWDGLAMRGVELRPIVAPDITHENLMREPLVKLLAEQLMRELEGEAHDASRAQHVARGD